MIRNIMKQTYDHNKIEWVVVDASEEKIFDKILNVDTSISFISAKETGPQPIGVMRNQTLDVAVGDILINMDDDDYYPDDYVETIVNILSNSKEHIAGSNKRTIFNLNNNLIYNIENKVSNYSRSCIMGYTKDYSKSHKYGVYKETEEFEFLNRCREPIVKIPSDKTGFGLMHTGNTCTKYINSKPTNLVLDDICPDKESAEFYKSLVV